MHKMYNLCDWNIIHTSLSIINIGQRQINQSIMTGIELSIHLQLKNIQQYIAYRNLHCLHIICKAICNLHKTQLPQSTVLKGKKINSFLSSKFRSGKKGNEIVIGTTNTDTDKLGMKFQEQMWCLGKTWSIALRIKSTYLVICKKNRMLKSLSKFSTCYHKESMCSNCGKYLMGIPEYRYPNSKYILIHM